ncbi:flagellar basal body L-ring protein FlgH [Pseudomonas lijiangensis]|uniref:Flagellar L-ring protein n=1 Tax=Pseudomonas lijiangensis TaxID=2995658 RepID=A0ABX8HSF4_9PSED|nr:MULTISPECIES: flagellar basal body L-ring protein FlgH [Pseudomonas syringae group]MBX8501133.1 flagellar basal body L-ring protein FlgH [Pseudomonas lijiangensis]MBX8505967.1 flagellar basal body L-ring protein FlgH [Pseudomonas lijiangensis]MBX8554100.1 flagellar basal body L-ring protein FlgH [Pseudomonas cichorii]QWU83168.1 flagellar basal body L-ring protein FlgH [Pseudomonas lijiangensis]
MAHKRPPAWPLLLVIAGMLATTGCDQLPHKPVVPEEEMQVPVQPNRLANGSLYQGSRGSQPLFEDRRPRMVGDTLTIELEEQVSASKTSSSNANRTGSIGLSLATTSSRASQVGDFGLDASTTNDFSGGGGSQANNSFTGTISVTVMQVMPNGHLRVRGDKQIAINQGTEFIRFSGVVNPRSITGENTVSSTQVSQARIEYVGDGYINEAQRMGWLHRILLNLSPF